MKTGVVGDRRGRRTGLSGVLPVVLALAAAGCSMPGKAFVPSESHVLEYPAPVFEKTDVLDAALKVERFSAARAFSGPDMVFRERPRLQSAYTGHRWRVSPEDMVTDLFLRDLRGSGLFRAVFSCRDRSAAWFVLEGGIGEFCERREDGRARAVLHTTLTLLDLRRSDPTKRVLFQKEYRFSIPMEEGNPDDLARAMSLAMGDFTREAIADVRRAVGDAVAAGNPPGS